MSAPKVRADVRCGEKAPSFVLSSTQGENVSLESFKGKYVVLEWFNHNCPYVDKFYNSGAMQKWQSEAASKGIVWLVIDSTNPSNPDFMPPKTARLIFTMNKMAAAALLQDEEGVVGRLYGATHTPDMFLISPEGIVIYQGAIDDKNTRNPEDAQTAHNYLLAAIDNALAGKSVEDPAIQPYGCEVKYKSGKSRTSDDDDYKSSKAAKSPATKQYRRGKRVARAS